MNIGLFFGSFNPVHTGHMIIAQHLANQDEIDEVWLVVSPQNPFKNKADLLNESDRLHMVNLAVESNPKIKSCDVEFNLPRPSYTVDTLAHLKKLFPQHVFALIMGSDSLNSFPKWKDHEHILKHHIIYIYNRPNQDENIPLMSHPNVKICKAPYLDISSTGIRNTISTGLSARYLLPDAVFDYVQAKRLYLKKDEE
jgi:nicotinate-nucleotide adenylyltransferase